MTGLGTVKGGNFKIKSPGPCLADLAGLFDHLRAVRLAFLAVGVEGGVGQAEEQNEQPKEPHAFQVFRLAP